MPKQKPTPVRFTEEQEGILKQIAEICRCKEVDAARWAVEALGQYFEAHGRRLLLPLNFSHSFEVYRIENGKKIRVFNEQIAAAPTMTIAQAQKAMKKEKAAK